VRRLVYHSLVTGQRTLIPLLSDYKMEFDMDSLGVGDGRREESWHSDVAAGPAWTLDRWVGVDCGEWSRLSTFLKHSISVENISHKDTALLIAIIS